MPAIASFIRLPNSKLGLLREAAVPRRRFLLPPKDRYPGFLAKHGEEIAVYDHRADFIGTLLCYLQERAGIDLMRSDEEELAAFLTGVRGGTTFVFTERHRRFKPLLEEMRFSGSELSSYYQEFNEEVLEPGADAAMFEGIRALRTALAGTDENHVVLLEMG